MPKFKLPIANRQSPIVILGIDPGLADTGFGVITIEKNKLRMVDFGIIKTKAKIPLATRLNQIYNSLNRLIKTYKPDTIGVEQLFFCKNVKTALAVGHARGVIMLTAGKNKVTTKEFTPLQVKQALTGYGQASKKQVQQMVKVILSLKQIPKPDDASDALAIAICCAHCLNSKFKS